MSNWYVYLLRCADDTLYCGITTDIKRRLSQHNCGKASKYTRARTPVVLEAYVRVADKSAALKLELNVKKQNRYSKVTFLEAHRDEGFEP